MKFTRWLLAFAAVVLLLLLLLLRTFSASPLPSPAAYVGALPLTTPPTEMAIFHLPTGITHRSAGFGYRGGSFADKRDFTMSAVLVKHPKGDLLIDSGFSADVDAHFAMLPWFFRWGTSYEKKTPAAAQLAKAGYDRQKLRGVFLTHGHWDHVSGLADLPDVPVFIPAAEREFLQTSPWAIVARNLPHVKYEEYGFDDKPYLGFAKSRDLYGDGSIVIVAAPGHTPGSIIVFLALPSGHRYALVGDLVWQREGITEREEKPWFMRRSADLDAAQVRANILRMAALVARFPELILVPAHDARGYTEIPNLP